MYIDAPVCCVPVADAGVGLASLLHQISGWSPPKRYSV
jgi:hypothetical protein